MREPFFPWLVPGQAVPPRHTQYTDSVPSNKLTNFNQVILKHERVIWDIILTLLAMWGAEVLKTWIALDALLDRLGVKIER